jgi:hypothetical protein
MNDCSTISIPKTLSPPCFHPSYPIQSLSPPLSMCTKCHCLPTIQVGEVALVSLINQSLPPIPQWQRSNEVGCHLFWRHLLQQHIALFQECFLPVAEVLLECEAFQCDQLLTTLLTQEEGNVGQGTPSLLVLSTQRQAHCGLQPCWSPNTPKMQES